MAGKDQDLHQFGESTREKINKIGGNVILFLLAVANAGVYIPAGFESLFTENTTADQEFQLYAFFNFLVAFMSLAFLTRSKLRKFGSNYHEMPMYWLITAEAIVFSMPFTVPLIEQIVASIQNAS